MSDVTSQATDENEVVAGTKADSKTSDVKASKTKKTAGTKKAAEKKTTAKTETKAPEKKAAVKEEPKPEEKKAAPKKPATKKPELKPEITLEYQNSAMNQEELMEKVKADWTAGGHRMSNVKVLKIYVKPEENKAYYVINDKYTGDVDLF